MLLKIIYIIAASVLIAVVYIKIKQYMEKIDKMYRAAGNIIRNENLDNSLYNPLLSSYKEPMMREERLMTSFTLKNTKPVKEYVFDPSHSIGIGRDKSKNLIILNEAIVSQEHCRINIVEDKICISDCGSANGTIVKRGLRSYQISGDQQIALEDGDIVVVGSTELKIKIFVYDTVWM